MKHLPITTLSSISLLTSLANHARSQTTQSGEDRAIEFIAPWPPWITILLLLFTAAIVYGLYSRERVDTAVWKKWGLATLRFSLLCIVLWMMYGFTERPFRTDLPDLLLIVDDSPSMGTVDAILDETLKSQITTDIQNGELAEHSRINQAKSILLRNDSELLKFLESNYQVKFSGLEATVAPQASGTDLSTQVRSLTTTGDVSRLGASLRRGLQQQRGHPVAAVLYLTDGITTDGPRLSEVSKEAKQRNVPLHIVGLGSQSPAKDLQLGDLLVNDVVFVGDLVTFDQTLSASGYANESIDVTLRRADGEGEPITQTIQITTDQEAIPVRLTFEATEKGTFDFVIETPPRRDEATAENNQLTARIEVRDEQSRVLLVQSYPNFEYHYLKTLLQRTLRDDTSSGGSVRLSVLLQDADPQFSDIDEFALRSFPSREELFEYDVCVFGDVNPSYLSNSALQDLRDFVVERGRGFIGIAGPRYFPAEYVDTPLSEIIPFEIRNALAPPPDLPIEVGFQARLTSLGQSMSAMQLASGVAENTARWSSLSELYWLLEVDSLKMGVRTLAEHPTRVGTSNEPFPIVTLSYAGAGKVLFHYTDDSWRWRIGRGDEIYGRYWQQTIRYLSRFKLGEGRDVELTSDRETYQRGETVRLRTRFFDDRLAPSNDQGVIAMLDLAGSRQQQVRLSRESTQRGTFSGDVGRLPTGKYHAWISEPTFEGDAPSVDFEVAAPDTELTRIQVDIADMQKAAKTSGGDFYTYATAKTLLRKLPVGRQVRIESLAPKPIWNSLPVAAAFVALLIAEWLLRRHLGMT